MNSRRFEWWFYFVMTLGLVIFVRPHMNNPLLALLGVVGWTAWGFWSWYLWVNNLCKYIMEAINGLK